MNTIEKIRAEIERRYAEYNEKKKTDDFFYYGGMADALDLFEQFIDTLSEEPDKDLEEAAEEYLQKVKAGFLRTLEHPTAKDCFKAGAEWQAKRSPLPEDTLIYKKGVEEGRRLEREDTLANLSYNELMELYKNIRDEIRRREEKK